MYVHPHIVTYTFTLQVWHKGHLTPMEYLCAIDETKRFWTAAFVALKKEYVVGHKHHMMSLDEPRGNHGWEDVRLAILDCLKGSQQVSDSTVCTCSTHAVFLYGCPSTKGKPCPSRQ